MRSAAISQKVSASNAAPTFFNTSYSSYYQSIIKIIGWECTAYCLWVLVKENLQISADTVLHFLSLQERDMGISESPSLRAAPSPRYHIRRSALPHRLHCHLYKQRKPHTLKGTSQLPDGCSFTKSVRATTTPVTISQSSISVHASFKSIATRKPSTCPIAAVANGCGNIAIASGSFAI